MSIWHIYGGNRLTGSTQVQGAKNAVLPIMAASVLAGSETVLHNVPDLKDVTITLRILRHLGCTAERDGDTVRIDSRGMNRDFIPHDLMRELRSSVIFLGAILILKSPTAARKSTAYFRDGIHQRKRKRTAPEHCYRIVTPAVYQTECYYSSIHSKKPAQRRKSESPAARGDIVQSKAAENAHHRRKQHKIPAHGLRNSAAPVKKI